MITGRKPVDFAINTHFKSYLKTGHVIETTEQHIQLLNVIVKIRTAMIAQEMNISTVSKLIGMRLKIIRGAVGAVNVMWFPGLMNDSSRWRHVTSMMKSAKAKVWMRH